MSKKFNKKSEVDIIGGLIRIRKIPVTPKKTFTITQTIPKKTFIIPKKAFTIPKTIPKRSLYNSKN